MNLKSSLSNLLFFDIETVPQHRSYNDLNEDSKALWDIKTKSLQWKDPDLLPVDAYESAGIYAEFGKIVCISVGIFSQISPELKIRITSFKSENETELLSQFSQLLDQEKRPYVLVGHNIKEFDIPYVCRRLLINGMTIPPVLNVQGLKPWEIQHIDTMEMWKFGDRKSYTSLKLLSNIFNVPSPKGDIDGSEVGNVYWEENNLERIAKYCEKDVLATARVFLKLRGLSTIKDENTDIV